MTPRSRPAAELELETDRGGRVRLTRVGASFAGWVYRAADPPACYRLLPLPDDHPGAAPADAAPLARRQDILDCVGAPRPRGVAPIAAAAQGWAGGESYFAVRYDVAAKSTLAEALAGPDALARLAAATAAVGALPGWAAGWYAGTLPLPADIVFGPDGAPVLLGLPFWRWPDAAAVLADPGRALFLPPELLRGAPTTADGMDLYVLGVALLLCFHRPPPAERADRVLARVANGTALHEPALANDLPYWMARVDAVKNVLRVARRLTHPDPARRHGATPDDLHRTLRGWAGELEPRAAVQNLIDFGKPADAYRLVQDILLARPDYDLMLLAAEIASGYQRLPLDAIDWYERAAALDPKPPAAYAGQFVAIQQALERSSGPKAETFAEKVRRDYERMGAANRERHAEPMARFLVDAREFAEAVAFVYPRIADDHAFSPETFGLNVLYARALGGMNRTPEARGQLGRARQMLDQARPKLRPADADLFDEKLMFAELELAVRGKAGAP